MIALQEFFDSYKESLGIEGAEAMIKDAVKRTGLSLKKNYSKEEALKICAELRARPGFIGIVGGILMSRIILK